MTYKTPTLILTTLILALTSGCTLITPYTPAIQQGKIIDYNIMQQLKPGMSKTQVEYLLGSPDIINPLSVEQWNYIYTYQSSFHAPRSEKKLILTFKDDKLTTVSGDYPPPQAIYNTKSDVGKKQTHSQTQSDVKTPSKASSEGSKN